MKKHIVCFGDSNTHGHCADSTDTADGGVRFNEEERWPCVLQELLGKEYLVIEEGLNGRTTAFEDPECEGRRGMDSIYSCLYSHKGVDLLILMLGTNDVKDRFYADAEQVGQGMEMLIEKAKSVAAWAGEKPNILLVAPPHILGGVDRKVFGDAFGPDTVEKSRQLASVYAQVAKRQGCAFLDAQGIGEFNTLDCIHLTRRGHRNLARHFAEILPELL